MTPMPKVDHPSALPNARRVREFTPVLHRGDDDEGGFWATCDEMPGANGQGATEEACLADLAEAVRLLGEEDGDPSGRPLR